jgi:hypothetical protein
MNMKTIKSRPNADRRRDGPILQFSQKFQAFLNLVEIAKPVRHHHNIQEQEDKKRDCGKSDAQFVAAIVFPQPV